VSRIAEYGTAERRAQDQALIEDPWRWPSERLPLKNPTRYNVDNNARAFGFLSAQGEPAWHTPWTRAAATA
jgi:hypothetical protein